MQTPFSYLRDKYRLRPKIKHQIFSMLFYSVLCMLIWFFTPLSVFFRVNVVKFIFNSELSSGASVFWGIFLILFTIGLVIYGICRVRKVKYLIPLKYFSPFLVVIFLYVYYRFFSNDFVFYSVFTNLELSCLKFLDLVFILSIFCGLAAIFCAVFELKEKPVYNSLLTVDSSLLNKEDDEFDREKYYDSLIKTLSSSEGIEKKALSIGLVNKWGEGKTSFIKFLEKKFKEDSNTIFLEFNAWHSSNSTNLTLDFFQTLDHELSKYIYTGSVLRRYAKSLTNINSVFNPFKYLPDSWVGDKSNAEYFEEINGLLQRLGKRIIVVIEDLDRLDNKEVFAVFQVIRNSANFDKVVFITPFDKDYVLHALSKLDIYNPDDYIKKVFDVEISLPPISNFYLIRAFEEAFKKVLDKLSPLTEENKKGLITQLEMMITDSGHELQIQSKYSLVSRMLFKYLKNKRDLIRFTNSVLVTLRDSHDLLYLPDVLLLELIKYLDVSLFREMFETTNYLYTESVRGDQTSKMIEAEQKGRSALKSAAYDIRKELKDREDLIELIKELFREPVLKDFNRDKSIYFSENYSSYHRFSSSVEMESDIASLLKK